MVVDGARAMAVEFTSLDRNPFNLAFLKNSLSSSKISDTTPIICMICVGTRSLSFSTTSSSFLLVNFLSLPTIISSSTKILSDDNPPFHARVGGDNQNTLIDLDLNQASLAVVI